MRQLLIRFWQWRGHRHYVLSDRTYKRAESLMRSTGRRKNDLA